MKNSLSLDPLFANGEQPRYDEEMLTKEQVEFIKAHTSNGGLRILFLFSCSSAERMSAIHISRLVGVPIDVMTVDMKPAEDGATVTRGTAIASMCGRHMQTTIDMNDMTGDTGSEQLFRIIKDFDPTCIIAHPDCTYWSCVGNGTYGAGKPRAAEARIKQHRNVKSILRILNFAADVNPLCSIIVENPQGKLNKRIRTVNEKMAPLEKMDHINTYNNQLVAAYPHLAKRTCYWSGGMTEAVQRLPLISNPTVTHLAKLKHFDDCKDATERSRTPKEVSLVTTGTAILRHAYATMIHGNGHSFTMQEWEDSNRSSKREPGYRPDQEDPPTSRTKEYAGEYWGECKDGKMMKLSGLFGKPHPEQTVDVVKLTDKKHRRGCNCFQCTLSCGTITVYDAGKEQAITFLDKTSKCSLTLSGSKRKVADINGKEFRELYNKEQLRDFVKSELTDSELIMKCSAASARASPIDRQGRAKRLCCK